MPITNNNRLNYFNSLILSNSKTELISKVKDSPLKPSDADFLCDVVCRLPYKELMDKYEMSLAGTYQRKIRCIEIFCNYLFYTQKSG